MSTITAHADHATLINVFTVQPERARELADLLTAATEEVMQHIDGFISANHQPLREAEPVRDLVAFFNERVDVIVDGQPRQRPITPFSD